MKIAFVSDVAYPWHVGGIEVINYNEASELKKRHDVDFFTLRWPGMCSDFSRNGIRYHTFHRMDKNRLYAHGRRSILEALSFSLGLFRLFDYDFDVVVSNQFPVLHLPMLYLYCWLKRRKLILEVVEVWDRNYWKSYLGGFLGRIGYACYSATMKGASHYIANSTITAEGLFRSGIPRDKVTVFTPLLDDRLIASMKHSRESNSRTIIFSGRLIKEKRMDKWLKVVKEVNELVRIKAVIIGNGPEKGNIIKEINKMGLSGIVTVRDFFGTKRELYKEIINSTAFLIMSEREGLGTVAIESIALGTPVFLPDYSPIPEEVRSMCVVADEEKLPDMIADLVRSGKKPALIRKKENLDSFRISKVLKVYGKIFSRINQE